MNAGAGGEFENAEGTDQNQRNCRISHPMGADAAQQDQGDTAEGEVGEAVADQGKATQHQKEAEEGAEETDQRPGDQGALDKAVAEDLESWHQQCSPW